jgi:hypothetical protein
VKHQQDRAFARRIVDSLFPCSVQYPISSSFEVQTPVEANTTYYCTRPSLQRFTAHNLTPPQITCPFLPPSQRHQNHQSQTISTSQLKRISLDDLGLANHRRFYDTQQIITFQNN